MAIHICQRVIFLLLKAPTTRFRLVICSIFGQQAVCQVEACVHPIVQVVYDKRIKTKNNFQKPVESKCPILLSVKRSDAAIHFG
jgi:hypothetical protein